MHVVPQHLPYLSKMVVSPTDSLFFTIVFRKIPDNRVFSCRQAEIVFVEVVHVPASMVAGYIRCDPETTIDLSSFKH